MHPLAAHTGPLLAIVAGLLTLAGNVYAKEWALALRGKLFALAVLFYLLGSVVFPFSLRFGTLGVLNTLSSIVPITATVLLGTLAYGETLTAHQIVGVSLGVVAIVLLLLPA